MHSQFSLLIAKLTLLPDWVNGLAFVERLSFLIYRMAIDVDNA